MNCGSCVEIRAGGVPCIRLTGLPDDQHRVLEAEFGAEGLSPRHPSATPLVDVIFRPVAIPDHAVRVGRTNFVDDGDFYPVEDGRAARIPMATLLDTGLEFTVEADPRYDLIRLIGYVLEPLAKVRALLRGHCFVHSSAVAIQERAVLLSAWGNTGKTNLMLKLAESGAAMLSDDWSLLMADGTVAGYPRPVNLMNYNLDMFPALRQRLSWRKKAVCSVDRHFRKFRAGVAWRNPAWLRAGDMLERLLEMGANARLPLCRFGPPPQAPLPAGAIVEVHKTGPGEQSANRRLPVTDAARAATACFAYENTRLFQRLAELAYASPRFDTLPAAVLALYKDTITRNLRLATKEEFVHSIGIPARPSMAELATLAEQIRELALPAR